MGSSALRPRHDRLPPGVGRRTSRAVFSSGLAALISLVLTTAPAAALDEKSGEKAQLKTCEKSFCNIILGKDGSKPADFQCLLSKTWAKSKIKENVDGKTTAWSLGDARCGATVTLPRQAILESKDAGKHVIQFAPHTVRCEVEKGTAVTVINVTLAPKIQFRNGNAEKAWIHLKNVDGPPTWKAGLWTVAKVEDTLGLFQKDVLKAINKLIHETCPAAYGSQAAAAAAPPKAAPKFKRPTVAPAAAATTTPPATAAPSPAATAPATPPTAAPASPPQAAGK